MNEFWWKFHNVSENGLIIIIIITSQSTCRGGEKVIRPEEGVKNSYLTFDPSDLDLWPCPLTQWPIIADSGLNLHASTKFGQDGTKE